MTLSLNICILILNLGSGKSSDVKLNRKTNHKRSEEIMIGDGAFQYLNSAKPSNARIQALLFQWSQGLLRGSSGLYQGKFI